ncbi:hypothetical protein L9F63_014595 [Diploptera punctata]|uniref:Uncharacterized protein n=1 Tax=Diploptera punctata TaxID=6984 RepID=A0AAD8EL76_DIPPU|nr:hypothetical protein L9F63_014595 [Diploptera punctata]
MWKCISRGLRETFERRINFTRKDTATVQESNTIRLQNKFIPCLLSTHIFDNGSGDLGGECKNGPCNEKKEQIINKEKNGEKIMIFNNLQYLEHWDGFKEKFKMYGVTYNFQSGVMVLGWYFCQPICRRRHTKPPDLDRFKNRANISRCHTEYISLLGLVSRIASAQPLSVLPNKTVAPKPIGHPVPSDPFVPLSADETDGCQSSESTTPFGPITGEQAVDEAAADLHSVLSEVEHRIGMACMQLGKHKEAISHFQMAMELDYAPAAFNLGLSATRQELATAQDLTLAAKYYKLASNSGHATAMYNLGVFHVRGWGGVQVDCGRARELFEAAAKLGQSNAIQALAMVPPVKKEESKKAVVGDTKLQDATRKLDPTQALYQLLGIKNSEINEENFTSLIHSKEIAPLPLVC